MMGDPKSEAPTNGASMWTPFGSWDQEPTRWMPLPPAHEEAG